MSGALFAALIATALPGPTTVPAPPAAILVPDSTIAPAEPGMDVPTKVDTVARMTVAVFINDQGPFQFVVDTGANRTVLSSALAARLMLPAGARAQLHDIAGVNGVETALVDRLRVGKRQVGGIVAPLLSAADMGADGILGIDGLVAQQVDIDFPKDKMTISAKRRASRDPDMIVVKARRRFGQLILADARVNGERVYVIVDSGAQYSVGNSVLRARMLKRRNAKSTPVTLVGVTGHTMNADYAITPEMNIGGIIMKNVPIAFSDVHPFRQFGLANMPAMLLGMDLLRAFDRVSLDFEEKKVSFQLKQE